MSGTEVEKWGVEFTEPLNGDRHTYMFDTEAEAREFATDDTTSGNYGHVVISPEPVLFSATPKPIHFLVIEVHEPSGEVFLAFKCEAEHGSDCWKRHPDAESWYADDSELINADSCWATEWIEADGIEDALKPAPGVGCVIAKLPVRISFDDGVVFAPVTLARYADEPTPEDMAVELYNVTDDGVDVPHAAMMSIINAYVPDLRICTSCGRAGGQHREACDVDPGWTTRA